MPIQREGGGGKNLVLPLLRLLHLLRCLLALPICFPHERLIHDPVKGMATNGPRYQRFPSELAP